MSIKVMTHVWENSKQHGARLLMLLAIADMADDNGDAWPSVARLARKCRVSERQARTLTQQLERANELRVYPGMGIGTRNGNTNLYRVVMDGNAKTPLTSPAASKAQVTVAVPRAATGVKKTSPLGKQGVKKTSPAAPQGVKKTSPQGVKKTSPNTSMESSDSKQTSDSPASNDAVARAPLSGNAQPSWHDAVSAITRIPAGIKARAGDLLAEAGDWSAALAAQAQKLDTFTASVPAHDWQRILGDELKLYAALLKLKPKAPKPALEPAVRDAIGEHVMGWGPRTQWTAYHWRVINAPALVRDLVGFNLTVDEMRSFKRWYYAHYSQDARYSHPNIIASKIDQLREDVRCGTWTLGADAQNAQNGSAAVRGGYHEPAIIPPGYAIPDDPELDRLFEETVQCLGTPRVSASA